MNALIADALWRYTGLHMSHLEALRDPGSASPAMRRALREGGLLDEAGGLTEVGRFARARAEEILSGSFREPMPLVEVPYIARHPGLALRFLRQAFGNAPLERLRDRGWIHIPEGLPWEAWSTPVEPTEEGLARLREGAGSHPKRGGRPCRASGLTPP